MKWNYKIQCLFFGLLFISKFLIAQINNKEEFQRYQLYRFKIECPMHRCDIDGKITDSSHLVASINSRFLIIYQEKDYYIIKFIINTKENRKRNINLTEIDQSTYRYYRIKQAYLEYKAEPAFFRKWSLIVGNVVTPIKIRINPFVFNKDLSIGPTLGMKYKKNQYSIGSFNMLIGMSITSVTLDSLNTMGYIKKNQESFAFTPSLGMMYELKNSQFGIFSGFDLLSASNSASAYFLYKNKPWISIGFGYAIFSTK